jgi:hypothetical protein
MDRDDDGIDAFFGIGSAIDAGRTDGERAWWRSVAKRPVRNAAFKANLL